MKVATCNTTYEVSNFLMGSHSKYYLNDLVLSYCMVEYGALVNVEDLYLLSGVVPPPFRRDVCARTERQKQINRETHSLFD